MTDAELLAHVHSNVSNNLPAGEGLYYKGNKSNASYISDICFDEGYRYTQSPKFMDINGHKVPVSEPVAPKTGTQVFFPLLDSPNKVGTRKWKSTVSNLTLLQNSLIFLSWEDAAKTQAALLGFKVAKQ